MEVFIWLVLLLGMAGVAAVWGLYVNLQNRQKELERLLQQKEEHLKSMYTSLEEMMDDFLSMLKETTEGSTVSIRKVEMDGERHQAAILSDIGFMDRRPKIEALLKQGFDIKDIARDMGIGRGEVLMVANLKKM